MKKMLIYVSLLVVSLLGLVGCATQPNQQTIDRAAGLLQQGAYQGAKYAIQQDVNNTKWFQLADTTIKTFATGQDLTPTKFESELTALDPSLQNQWVQLAVDVTITSYDGLYSQYVINQVDGNAIAKELLLAVTSGFDQALGTNVLTLKTGGNVVSFKAAQPVERPSVVRSSTTKK